MAVPSGEVVKLINPNVVVYYLVADVVCVCVAQPLEGGRVRYDVYRSRCYALTFYGWGVDDMDVEAEQLLKGVS